MDTGQPRGRGSSTRYKNIEKEKSDVIFVSYFAEANLCRGGGGARRPTKNGRRRLHIF